MGWSLVRGGLEDRARLLVSLIVGGNSLWACVGRGCHVVFARAALYGGWVGIEWRICVGGRGLGRHGKSWSMLWPSWLSWPGLERIFMGSHVFMHAWGARRHACNDTPTCAPCTHTMHQHGSNFLYHMPSNGHIGPTPFPLTRSTHLMK